MSSCSGPLLVFCLLALTGAGASSLRPLAEWRFRPGDEMAWAAPGFDDGDWQRVKAPALERLPWVRPRGWFRCVFPLAAAEREEEWGVWLGRIESADEVYLNGQLIGGAGVVADAFVDAPRKLRLYRLPREHLAASNTLAVRVQSSYPSGGLADRPELGAYPELLDRLRRLEARQAGLDAFLIGVMLALLLFWAVLRLHGLRRPEHRHAQWLALMLAAVFVFESPLVQAGGWVSPALCRVYIALCLALPVPVLGLAVHLGESPWLTRCARIVRWCALGLAALYLVFGGLRVCATFQALWIALLAATMVVFVLTWRSPAARRSGEVRMLGIGLVFLGVAAMADFVLGVLGSPWSHLPLHLCCAVFALATMLGVGSRFARMQQILHALSQRLLTSREDEAKRISRDLHDGLGQALASTKLNLQCIRQQHAGEKELAGSLDSLIRETSQSIDLLHRTVHNLRPASLSELGFAAALRELGDTGGGAGPVFQFELDDGIRCAADVEDNLYRIAQEAVGNAIRHANCKTIWIRLVRLEGTARLEIDDDGDGFEWKGAEGGTGLGLVAMRERLLPFGGRLVVRTEPGGGTTVRAEVPEA